MIWYLINIIILTITWFASKRNNNSIIAEADDDVYETEKYRRKRLCIVGSINWIILSGCRGLSVGADTENYANSFNEVVNTSWSKLIYNFYSNYFLGENIKDPGYKIVEKIFQIFSTENQLWLVFIAIVFFVSMGIWIYKYSEDPYLSFILFSTLFYSFFAITGQRQTLATAIVVFWGMELIKRRKLIPFLAIVILCSTIHTSVLCVIPFYWISQIKNSKITVWIWWIGIACAYVFRYQFLSLCQSLIGYESYADNEGAGAGLFVFLLLAIALMTSIFYESISYEQGEVFDISVNALYVACVFSSLLLINQNAMRVVQYYSLYLMIYLPFTKKLFSDNGSKGIYTAICIGILIISLISKQPYYTFFWME